MDYKDFIEELRPLYTEARSLFGNEQTHQSHAFRKWRHRVTALISRIEEQGYSVDCNISSRIFDVPSYGSVSRAERIAAYDRELQDTLNELESLIEHFDKYGDPRNN